MFETRKSRHKTNSGEIGINIRTHASPKVGHDQVSRRVNGLCWHAAPVANVLFKPRSIRQKVKFGYMVQISSKDKKLCNVGLMEGGTVDSHPPECRVIFGRGDLIFLAPVSTIELPYRRFQTFRGISLPEIQLYLSMTATQWRSKKWPL